MVEAGATKSYTYNPNGMNVKLTEWKYRKRWTCTTGNNDANNRTKRTKEKSYCIKPSILIKKTNGTKNAIKVTSYVSYFQLHGGVRTYTNNDTISCSIKFKNHKKA